MNGKWSETLSEYSTAGSSDLLSNTTDRINAHDNAIRLSLPLGPMGFPSKYKVMFYAREIITNEGGFPIKDYPSRGSFIDHDTSWIDIPPPSFALSTPNPITLRPGKETTVIADLSSNVGLVNILSLKPGYNGPNNETNKLQFTVYNTDPPSFKVKVPENSRPGIYKIPLLAKLEEESPFPLNNTITERYAPIVSLPIARGSVPAAVNLTMTVLQPLSIQEQINEEFKDFWTIYGQPISIILGGFAGGMGSLIFDRKKKKRDARRPQQEPSP
jgi:hypothetical protein